MCRDWAALTVDEFQRSAALDGSQQYVRHPLLIEEDAYSWNKWRRLYNWYECHSKRMYHTIIIIIKCVPTAQEVNNSNPLSLSLSLSLSHALTLSLLIPSSSSLLLLELFSS
jgi:hypothetical protein